MSKNNLFAVLFVVYSIVLLGAGYWMGQSGWPLAELGLTTSALSAKDREALAPFLETWNLVNERYFDQPVDREATVQGAIDGMLATLGDPHTRYLPPDAEAAARDAMEGEMEGIGVIVEEVEGRITVVSPFEGSPAERAGLAAGDVLLAADGVELTGLGLDAAARLIRGPAGTEVLLLVEREGETFEVSVTRDVFEVPSVRGEMLEEGVAYVRLSSFANRTAEELNTILDELLAQEPKGLILDLRGNPGGGLESAVDVADVFLNEGIVLVERFGSGEERVYRSTDGEAGEEITMVVLIDEGSASASEVLAGALRDRERAILMGATSYGKGTVQTWHALSNGGGVRITVARWLTPDGDWVSEAGLVPEEMVALPGEGEPFEDTQLEAAIDYFAEVEATAQP